MTSSVGLAAQLALAGALPELDFTCGLGTLSLLHGDVVADADSLRPLEGYPPSHARRSCSIPLLEAYQLADPQRVTGWHERLGRVCTSYSRSGLEQG